MNGIKYKNGKYISGKIDKKMRDWHKKKGSPIPQCDTIFFRLKQKGLKEIFFSMTYDEAAGIVMLLAESVWYEIPRVKRIK